uniref:Uncharacterized protein n=1 Tax=uncultured marine virus TaxID=186617 RepID=A0A0F7LB91_9VIRU|nr:hypothetical protein [uncultured marine virus]
MLHILMLQSFRLVMSLLSMSVRLLRMVRLMALWLSVLMRTVRSLMSYKRS